MGAPSNLNISADPKQEAKRRQIHKLCGATPDALSILSGSLAKRELRNGRTRYSSPSYQELDVAGLISGGKARVIAAAEIAPFYPDVPIIANGHTYENAPADAGIMKEELGRYGISANNVFLQKQSYSTFTELLELVKFVAEHGWRRVLIITNEFQIARAQEMLRQIETLQDPYGASQDPAFRAAVPTFRKLAPEVAFVAAEAVLPLRHRCYQKIVNRAKASPLWEERIAREAQGLKQLHQHTYWNGVTPKKKEPFRL